MISHYVGHIFVFDDSFMIFNPGLILSNQIVKWRLPRSLTIIFALIGQYKGQALGQPNIS